ncbi:hypothetical protein DSM3645_00525 [Blastopirellula marina DSM 3645]|uniref:Uncharacterized protein n=1 Tax=Blastopirellula marina DSM 3645 TaxID=314230 RepID=A3ZMI0_9BACT|nr:hypothetical protein DSM3645_00525 [Blastopirellula marina DSM 3645]
MFVESQIIEETKLASLRKEADELLRVIVTAIRNTRPK